MSCLVARIAVPSKSQHLICVPFWIQVDISLERRFAAQEMAADRTLVKLFLEAVKVLNQIMCCAWGLEYAMTGIDQLVSRDLGTLNLLVQNLSHT